MKNIHRVIIFVGIFLFLPAHSIIANITNPGFNSVEEEGLYGWEHNDLVSAFDYPDASSGKAAHFLPDYRNTNPLSTLSQVFTIDLGLETLSFNVEITTFESGIFTAALLDPKTKESLVDTVDGINFFTISSAGIQLGDKEVDVSSLGEREAEVELVFNLNNYDGNFDTEAWLYNLNISVIPVPGAVVLGGIGACIVGWLRRRRSL